MAAPLAGIAIGRLVGWYAGGFAHDGSALVIELTVLAAALVSARGAAAPAGGERPRRRLTHALTAVTVVSLSAVVGALSPSVQQRLYDGAAGSLAARVNQAPLADDALRVAICGSSAPLASAARAKACVAVFAGGRVYVVDVGPESVENLVRWGIPLSSIGGVLLTHFHSDHIGDLGELNLQTWAAGRPGPLQVYGGPGVERVVEGFTAAYRLDQGYRTQHHGERVMPSATWAMVPHVVTLDGGETPARDRTGTVMDVGGLRVTAIEVDHSPIAPAYAYRFDYRGRSVVITGDLRFHPPLARAARGADVLVSEAIAPSMTRALGRGAHDGGRDRAAAIMHDIEDYHVTPERAAQLANEAGVRLLVFYHLLPAPDGWLARRVFARGIDEARRGDWAIADDGSVYSLPYASRDVRIGTIDD